MKLKLQLPSSSEIISLTTRPDSELTVQDLVDCLNEKYSLTQILAGYPPKPIEFQTDESRSLLLSAVGIKNGEQLRIHVNEIKSVQDGSKSSSFATKAGNLPSQQITGSATTTRHVGAATSSSSSSQTREATRTQKPTATGTRSKQGLGNSSSSSSSSSSYSNVDRDRLVIPCGESYIRLRVMEDDNSCMFRAVGYAFMHSLDTMFELRNVVADAIRQNPFDYNDAILGKPADQYIKWILRENSWGGAIELDILSKHFDVTICSLDVSTSRIDHFNPGKDRFIIVVYSGIHYDAVALTPLKEDQGISDFDTTVFSNDDLGASVLESLNVLGKELKNMHYYTDTAGFELTCKICGVVVKGERGATKHAESTGHVDFGEV